MTRRVAIVGGGITGLALAEAVERKSAGQPIEAIVLEADATPGGKIKSRREEGFVVDDGPHGFLDKEPLVFELIDRLGLRGDLISANEAAARRYIVRGGALREVPTSPPKFLTSDILPFTGRLRVLFEPFARSRPDGDESVWSFAARRIGRQAADVLVDAMVTGIYGGDPKRLSLVSAFPRMREIEDQYGSLIKAQLQIAKAKKQLPAQAGQPTGTMHSFRDGLGQLTSALASRAQVRTNFTADRIERNGTFVVHGSGEPVEADAVVLAVPAPVAAGLLGPHAPAIAEIAGGVPYAPIAVVVQGFDAAAAPALDGFGFLAPHVEARPVLGSIWASSVFPEQVPKDTIMFRTMVGGARNADLARGSDDDIRRHVRAELEQHCGLAADATPRLERIIRWPDAIPQYEVGHAERVAAVDALEREVPGLFVTGNAFRGVALLTCVADAERVAGRVVEALSKG